MPPTMEEMAVGERARINSAIATARSAVGAVGDDATDAQVTAAEKALSDLQATINAASNVPEHERNAHTATHDVIEADLTAAKMSRQMAMDAADDRMQEDAMKMAEETRATARKLFHAIERDREFDNTGGKATHLRLTKNMKGLSSGLITSPLDLTISNGLDPDASNEQSTTTTTNSAGVNSMSNVYHPSIDGIPVTEMLPDLAGWKGLKYVSEHPDDPLTCQYPEGCMKGITDHVVVYTNQADAEPANSETFAERYGVDSDDNGTPDNEWYKPATSIQNAHITTAGLNGNDAVGNWHLIASEMFSTAGAKPHTREDDPETEGVDESMTRIRGTFDGAAGVYICTGTGADVCRSTYLVGDSTTSTPDSGTPYVLLSGGGTDGWTFIVDNANAMVTLGDPAASAMFVTYGYWMRELSGDDGWTDVRPFSENGSNGVPHANGVAQAIKGSASYSGSAAGMYAIYHPVAADSSSGHWTANAMLTADFDEQMVSGELTGFMAEGQAMDWKVELLEADINAADPAPSPPSRSRSTETSGFFLDGSGHGFANAENGTVWTMGDMDGEKTGSWYGDFWAAGATVDSTAANNPAPAAATGVFWAEHGDTARMTGAFGVTRDEGN